MKGVTPLHIAFFGGHTDVMEMLVSKGGEINAQNKASCTPVKCRSNFEYELKK